MTGIVVGCLDLSYQHSRKQILFLLGPIFSPRLALKTSQGAGLAPCPQDLKNPIFNKSIPGNS